MSIVTDPTFLMAGNLDTAATLGAEVTIDTTAFTIKINPGQGDLPAVSDGVSFQALYSAFKLVWKNSATYLKFKFPFESITPEQFEITNGWTFADTTTRKAIRNSGWAERNSAGAIIAMYAGIISLGTLGATDQPYFQLNNSTTAATNFNFTGSVNEAIQIYSDPNGDGNTADGFDYRTYLKIFAREQQKSYAAAALSDIGVTTMTYIAYRFPLSNASDLKVLATDAALVADTTTYGGITVTYYTVDQVRNIGGTNYNYRILINGNSKTAEQIYTKVQYLLRQNIDIDSGAGTANGKTSDALLKFIGDTLVTSTGVYIDSYNANDTNRLTFTDTTATGRTYPYVAAGNLLFNANLVNDPNAIYSMYFTSTPTGNFGTTNAILVQNSAGSNISGSITSGSIPFSFNYDSNVQGGRTAGTDAAVTVVAIGLTTGQYVLATSTITRATGQNITLTAALERNYNNA
jgi:hypothetical protein